MSERVQHNRPTEVAIYGDCELTTEFQFGSAGNSRIMTAHLPQCTQTIRCRTKRARASFRCVQHISLNNTVELIFNHTFGRQEQQDIVYTPVWAYADEYEDGDMLETGWLLLDRPHNNRECWYQSRSVRVDADRYTPRFPKHQYDGNNITIKEIFPQRTEDLALLPLKSIYDQYISRKGFVDLYDPFRWLSNRTSFLLFECKGEIVGFTKIRRYYWENMQDAMFPGEDWESEVVAGIETVLHASSVPISAISADLEIQWAVDQGASYVYLGAGYEQGSEYKSSFRGFEWWTGSEWSRQKKMYKKLCKRDSETKLIEDLPSK